MRWCGWKWGTGRWEGRGPAQVRNLGVGGSRCRGEGWGGRVRRIGAVVACVCVGETRIGGGRGGKRGMVRDPVGAKEEAGGIKRGE